MPTLKPTEMTGGVSASLEGVSQKFQSTQYKNSSTQGKKRLLSQDSENSSSENNASLD